MERVKIQQYHSNTATDLDIKSKVVDVVEEDNKLIQGEIALVNTDGNEAIYHLNSEGNDLVTYLPIGRINGSNVKITSYVISDKDDSQLAPVQTDSVNEAIGKLHKALINDEYVISLGISRINDSCGFNENGRIDLSDTNYLSPYKNIASALRAIDAKLKELSEFTLIQ